MTATAQQSEFRAKMLADQALRDEQDRVVALAAARTLPIAYCPLVPHVDPALKCYRGAMNRESWFVSVEAPSVQDWDICGPNRPTPVQAIEVWNQAWAKS